MQQIVNVIYEMSSVNVLYDTEVIFSCLSHSQARHDALLYTFSVRLNVPLDMETVLKTET